MSFPEDNYLLAKGTDIDAVSGDINFFIPNEAQLVGCLKMLNERRGAISLPKVKLLNLQTTRGGGYISVDGSDQITGPEYRVIGNSQILEASPEAGYEFVKWSGDVDTTDNPFTPPSTYDLVIQIYANFKPIGEPDPTPGTPIKGKIADALGGFRFYIAGGVGEDGILQHYLNTDLSPGGNLHNQSSYSAWTLATVLSSIGGGVSGKWTRIPARNIYGLDADFIDEEMGETLRFAAVFKEQINELVQVINKCSIPIYDPTSVQVANRFGNSTNGDCATSKTEASTNYDAASWVSVSDGEPIQKHSFTGGAGAIKTQLSAQRGKIQVDLSSVSSGTAKAWLQISMSGNEFGQTRPTTADEGKFGEWAAAGLVVGSLQTTGYVTESDTKPVFTAGQAACASLQVGWITSDMVVLVTGVNWQYSL